MNEEIKKLKSRLLEWRSALDIADASGESEQAIVTLDQQSVGRLNRMDALQRQQMAKETARRRALERARINAALARIDDDEFGWCVECGEPIAAGRLCADPTAHLCVDCAS